VGITFSKMSVVPATEDHVCTEGTVLTPAGEVPLGGTPGARHSAGNSRSSPSALRTGGRPGRTFHPAPPVLRPASAHGLEECQVLVHTRKGHYYFPN